MVLKYSRKNSACADQKNIRDDGSWMWLWHLSSVFSHEKCKIIFFLLPIRQVAADCFQCLQKSFSENDNANILNPTMIWEINSSSFAFTSHNFFLLSVLAWKPTRCCKNVLMRAESWRNVFCADLSSSCMAFFVNFYAGNIV